MIGQHHRRERSRAKPRHLDDLQSGKRARHGATLACDCKLASPRYGDGMIEATDRSIFTEDHNAFRDTVRRVLADVIEPRLDDHERDGIVEREAWEKVGETGLLCPQVPEAYGGPGLDFS